MVRWFVSCIESVVAQRATSVHGRAGGQLIAHACSYIRVPRCVDRCQRKEMRKKKRKKCEFQAEIRSVQRSVSIRSENRLARALARYQIERGSLPSFHTRFAIVRHFCNVEPFKRTGETLYKTYPYFCDTFQMQHPLHSICSSSQNRTTLVLVLA